MGIVAMLVFLLAPVPISRACGPIDRSFYGYSFINPAIVNLRTTYAPFILDLYEQFFKQPEIQLKDNLTEWRERFCNKATMADLQYVIYEVSAGTLEEIKSTIGNKTIPLNYLGPEIANNSFVKYLYRNKCIETLDYLIFAKRCEPHVVARKAWDDREKDRSAMQDLIDLGQRAFMRTESHYFRLRYAYQLLRLAHYAGKFSQVLELYDFLMPKIDSDPSLIDYWIMGHRAGALMALGKNVEASYLFSRIFEKCPSKRESAFRSFKIKTNEEWKQCLLLCKNDHEKAILYLLRAESAQSQLVPEMLEVYALDPTNPSLELLTLRELQKLEKNLLGYEFNDKKEQNRRYHNIPQPGIGQRVIDLQAFVRKVQEDGIVKRPAFWKIIEGYLELLAGDRYYARETFSEAKKMVKNDTLRSQLETFELVMKIDTMDQVTEKDELDFMTMRRKNVYFKAYPDFNDFLRDKLASLYQARGAEGKAFMCYYEFADLLPNPKIEVIEDLLEIANRDSTSNAFEKSMILKATGTTIRNELLDLKASYQLSQNRPEAALEAFRQIPEKEWDNYGLYNPFVPRVIDCVKCPIPDTLQVFNKAELLQKFVDLEYEARSELDPNKSARIYMKLGLGWYNMTYFSYSWRVMDYFRSGSSILRSKYGNENNIINYLDFPFGNRENFDCSKALAYFERASLRATDPEIKAQAIFLAAKCEQNYYYANKNLGTAQTFNNFQMLVSDYSKTKFYDRLITECKYFATYVNR
ncbi:MAG: hypothetical protein DHS20C18_52560 [Saprospiraceae bacterium]|nr:MAG: hypothetical protein DHS20C18_52560 [Saprospiraceae bacterium]